MKRLALAACACAALFLPSAAHAQADAWERQVRTILQQVGRVFEAEGFEMTHRLYTGALDEGGEEMVDVTLEVGKEYQIVGACDEDCTDLDLTLYDGAGNEVDIDIEEDDAPIVSVAVGRSGAFRLKVNMATCGEAPCRYGVGVFGK